MSDGGAVFAALQRAARAEATRQGIRPATAEYVTRHGLESFLARLSVTQHAPNFVLKGGLLIAAYASRRPTRDIDSQVNGATLNHEYLRRVIDDIVNLPAGDGMRFHVENLKIETIRDSHEYPGVRIKLPATLGSQPLVVTWDVSTGDPVVPDPRIIQVPRILGDPITVRGYAPETVVAEKGVTILQRGTTSTRWRDYVDIVQLDKSCTLDRDTLITSSQAVAATRGISLEAISDVVTGYGALSQRKWAAWRLKAGVQDLCAADLDEQMRLVAQILDPIFAV